MKVISAYYLLIFILFFSGCGSEQSSTKEIITEPDLGSGVIPVENPEVKGNRLFGINISENKNGFEDAFSVAQQAGVEVVELNIPWSAIEVSSGQYQDPWNGVIAATAFYGEHQIKLNLSLAVINTVKWEVPSY